MHRKFLHYSRLDSQVNHQLTAHCELSHWSIRGKLRTQAHKHWNIKNTNGCATLAVCFPSSCQSWLFTADGNNKTLAVVSYPFLLSQSESVEQARRMNYLQLALVHATSTHAWLSVCVCVWRLFMQFTGMIHVPRFIVFCFNEAATLICALRQQTSKGATSHTSTCMLHSSTAIAFHGICISSC